MWQLCEQLYTCYLLTNFLAKQTKVTKRIKIVTGHSQSILHSQNDQLMHLGWWRGVVVSGVRRMNEVNARRARLILGWETVFGRVYHLGM